MNLRVVRVRSAACVRVTHPRSTPVGYAVSANPMAATLEKLFVGHRSGVSPLLAFVFSQNQLNVRCSSVSRNAVCLALRGCCGAGTVVAVGEHANTAASKSRKERFIGVSLSRMTWRNDHPSLQRTAGFLSRKASWPRSQVRAELS